MDNKSSIPTAEQTQSSPADSNESGEPPAANPGAAEPLPREIGGRGGLEPTRYGDWEKNGRCIDF